MNYRQKYMELALQLALQLRQDDALTINVEKEHQEFAFDLAQMASEISCQEVNVLLIEQGEPVETFQIRPQESDLSLQPIQMRLLLRLESTFLPRQVSLAPAEIVKDLPLLQRLGNLSLPHFDRQIAPWAVLAIPEVPLGGSHSEEEFWALFAPVWKLNHENPLVSWQETLSLIESRVKKVNQLGIRTFHIRNQDSEFEVEMANESYWKSDIIRLGNNRMFLPHLPVERVSFLPHRLKSQGFFKAAAPFYLLGQVIQGARFELDAGRVVSFSADQGEDVLALVFNEDEGARYLGEISLVEKYAPLSNITLPGGAAGFFENATSTLLFGTGDSDHLPALDQFNSAQEMCEASGCNSSTISFRIPLETTTLAITSVEDDIIMYNGDFKI